MGLLDLFFKSGSARTAKTQVGNRGQELEVLPPDPTCFLVPRQSAPLIIRPVLPAAPAEAPRIEAAPVSRQIVVAFSDVLGRIPPEFLKSDASAIRRELRFGKGEYFADIPRGRVTVALSNIAAQCPEAFRVPIAEDDDREVRLPLQKVLDQIVGDAPPPTPREVQSEPVAVTAPAPPAPPAEAGGDTIQLSLAAILAGCPDEVFAGERPSVDEAVRVTLPLEPIERQLASGAVEVSAPRFLSLLPPSLAATLRLRDHGKILLPLEEIFRNLPAAPAPPIVLAPEGSPKPGHPEASADARAAFRFFSPVPAADAPAAQLAGLPIGRPLVVLPPPLAASAEPVRETTSDQTAVLEFLSGGDEAKS